MLGISAEHLLIAFVILLIFGPKRLPQVGATLGKSARNFKDHFNGIREPEFRKISETIEPRKES